MRATCFWARVVWVGEARASPDHAVSLQSGSQARGPKRKPRASGRNGVADVGSMRTGWLLPISYAWRGWCARWCSYHTISIALNSFQTPPDRSHAPRGEHYQIAHMHQEGNICQASGDTQACSQSPHMGSPALPIAYLAKVLTVGQSSRRSLVSHRRSRHCRPRRRAAARMSRSAGARAAHPQSRGPRRRGRPARPARPPTAAPGAPGR